VVCPENYKKVEDKNTGEYVCIGKNCKDRIPFKNKTCSIKEDFLNDIDGESSTVSFEGVKCYYLDKDYDDSDNNYHYYYYDYGKSDNNNLIGKCVEDGECPVDYPGVFLFIYLFYVLFKCFCIKVFFLLLLFL
jgi:hypothetical protein